MKLFITLFTTTLATLGSLASGSPIATNVPEVMKILRFFIDKIPSPEDGCAGIQCSIPINDFLEIQVEVPLSFSAFFWS